MLKYSSLFIIFGVAFLIVPPKLKAPPLQLEKAKLTEVRWPPRTPRLGQVLGSQYGTEAVREYPEP